MLQYVCSKYWYIYKYIDIKKKHYIYIFTHIWVCLKTAYPQFQYIYIFFTSTLKTAICGYPVFTRLNGYTNHLIINLAVCEQCWIMIGI